MCSCHCGQVGRWWRSWDQNPCMRSPPRISRVSLFRPKLHTPPDWQPAWRRATDFRCLLPQFPSCPPLCLFVCLCFFIFYHRFWVLHLTFICLASSFLFLSFGYLMCFPLALTTLQYFAVQTEYEETSIGDPVTESLTILEKFWNCWHFERCRACKIFGSV